MAAIDVLMPMRDAGPWIAAAWWSLKRQTLRDWRLIAVDDGSRDDGAEVLKHLARGDRRLTLIRQPPGGVAAALNRGLREVAAPLTARMDADDVVHPRRLELLVRLLREKPEAGVAASRVRLFPRRAVSPAMDRYLEWQNGLLEPAALRAERYVECTLTHASALFRTHELQAVQGWWTGDGPEDLDLFLRLHRAGVDFAETSECLYFWREHPARETRTSQRLRRQAFVATKARHLAAELSGRGIGRVGVWGRGTSLGEWVAVLAGLGLEARAVEHRPGDRVSWPVDFPLFCFGDARVRARLRPALAGREPDRDYLFVA